MSIRVNENNNIILKGDKVSCSCCYEMRIIYDWGGTDQYDLDTNTSAFGANVGYACGSGNIYVDWISGDNTGINSFESVDVRVNLARAAGLWTSSYNISCRAGWYTDAGGSGDYNLKVTYNGYTKSLSSSAGSQSGCASYLSRTVTVYANALSDGSYFEIV